MRELKNRNIFEIKKIFLFLTVYFVIIPFAFKLDSKSMIAMSVIMVGSLSFLVGAATRRCFYEVNGAFSTSGLSIFIGFFIVAMDFTVGIYKFFWGISATDYTSSFFIVDYDSLYLKIIWAVALSFKYYYLSLFISESKRYFYLALVAEFVFSISSPIRLVALQPVIIFVIFGYYFGYFKISFLKIILGLAVSPFIFVFLLLGRGLGGASFSERMIGALDIFDSNNLITQLLIALESFSSFEIFTNIIESNFVHVDSGILRVFLLPISRSIWPEKPESVSRIISKEFNFNQYVDGGGTVALIFGDAFISGHVVGVILILGTLGFFSRIIYCTMKKRLHFQDSVSAVLVMSYAVFVYDFMYFYRGFFSEFFWTTVIFQTSLFVFLKLRLGIKPVRYA